MRREAKKLGVVLDALEGMVDVELLSWLATADYSLAVGRELPTMSPELRQAAEILAWLRPKRWHVTVDGTLQKLYA